MPQHRRIALGGRRRFSISGVVAAQRRHHRAAPPAPRVDSHGGGTWYPRCHETTTGPEAMLPVACAPCRPGAGGKIVTHGRPPCCMVSAPLPSSASKSARGRRPNLAHDEAVNSVTGPVRRPAQKCVRRAGRREIFQQNWQSGLSTGATVLAFSAAMACATRCQVAWMSASAAKR